MKNVKNMKNDEEYEALQNFLLDIQCLDELLPWISRFNIFDVLKITRTEIRHSNVLAWLFNSSEGHGLGDIFIRAVMQKLVENDSSGRYDVFRILLMDTYSFNVFREWNNIDILLVSDKEKLVIAIENKVDSREHDNQLVRYKKTVEKYYKEYNHIFIYLTPDGEEPSDSKNWDTFSYADIADIADDICRRNELLPEAEVLIKNYIEVLRRDIVEDRQLIEICDKIYQKHQKALDLIYNNIQLRKDERVGYIRKCLQDLTDEGIINFYKNSRDSWLEFHTDKMDEVLPPLKGGVSGFWSGRNYIYTYGIKFNKDNKKLLEFNFELGGVNVPKDKEWTVMQKMFDKLDPYYKSRYNFQHRRLYQVTCKISENGDDLENEVMTEVRKCVNEILEWEDKFIPTLSL